MPNRKSGNPLIAEYDGVYVDSVNGDTIANGATGTPNNPVSNLTDALTVAASWKVNKIFVYDYTTNLLIPSDVSDPDNPPLYFGRNKAFDALDTNGKDLGFGAYFRNLEMSGTFSDTDQIVIFEDCFINTFNGGTNAQVDFYNCIVTSNTLAVKNLSAYNTQFPYLTTLDLTPSGTTKLINISGAIVLTNMLGGGTNIYGSGLALTIDASCTAGTINIYGDCDVTDNSTGTTVNDYTINTMLKAIKAKTDLLP